MPKVWSAPSEIEDLLQEIKEKWHPHLHEASFAIEFVESKPFVKDRINLGKVSKFSQSAKLWQSKKYDFLISLCVDVWHTILNTQQKAPLLDLHLSQCKVEFEPETVEVNGKTEKVKDEWVVLHIQLILNVMMKVYQHGKLCQETLK